MMVARFSVPIQISPGVHPVSVQWVLGLFPGGMVTEAWH